MKFISVKSVVEAYKGFQDCMTNKSWGYLALLKGCKSSICPSVPYEVNLDEVSSFLENIFNLSQAKKRYGSGRVLYVVFSNKWDKYFNDQGRHTPNIYDVAIWAYRRNSFEDNMTKEEISEIIRSAGLDERIRGEAMSLQEFGVLADKFYNIIKCAKFTFCSLYFLLKKMLIYVILNLVMI